MMDCDGKIEDELSSKNLVSVEDLKLLFKFNDIQTTLTDDELERLISMTQANMLAELGITLKPVQHTYTVYPNYTEPRKQARVPITLPLVHVKNIDEIKINKMKILVEGVDYDFDEKNSIIYLKPRYYNGFWHWWWYWHWGFALMVRIKYTTQFDDEFILDLLGSLLGDILVYQQTPMMNRDVKSIKEGDVTVSWDTDINNVHTLPRTIADKKQHILDLLNSTRVMMI
jgi:hypothetical protein